MSTPTALDADRAPNRPLGHRPHAPAWTTPGPSHAVLEQLAVQYPDGHPDPEALRAPLEQVVALPDGPGQVDRATHVDAHGMRNDILLAYWADPVEHARWAAQPEVTGLWSASADLPAGVGRWRERLGLRGERLETLDSAGEDGRGLAALDARHEPTEVHEYWGAMRDRMPASHDDPLNGDAVGTARAAGRRAADGDRLALQAPESTCFIRTGQDWSATQGRERATYEQSVAPVLAQGADFLHENPDATGCLAARLVFEVDEHWGPQDRSCVLAWFRSLGHLERWTWSHPTHAAIFDAFMALVAQERGGVHLGLWHEVAVLAADDLALEYVNCHPATGLLATLGRPTNEEEHP